MTTDYAALTDDALNRLIAERRGWTDYLDDDTGIPQAIPPGEYENCDVPFWATDLNAAAELLKEMDDAVMGHGNTGVLSHQDTWYVYRPTIVHKHADPARAIAEAWCIFGDMGRLIKKDR